MASSTTSMAPIESPFYIRPEDIAALNSSEAFQVLRKYLAENANNSFCHEHSQSTAEGRQTWLLHRDILHALIMPIVQLFNRASRLAEAALCSSKPEDLEMAFTGDARSAFLWLQCFLSDEEQWCHSVGCPACIVSHTLSAEENIRLTFTALHLANDTASHGPNSLPALPFFGAALTAAINTDPFWDSYPGATSSIESSAASLASNVRALMSQCGEIEALVADYPAKTPMRSPIREHGGGQLPAVKPSRMARRQQRLRQEEQVVLQKLVAQCWGRVALQRSNLVGFRERSHVRAVVRESAELQSLCLEDRRRRSLTCP